MKPIRSVQDGFYERDGVSEHQPNRVVKATSRVCSRGQIVIPIEIRKTLGLTEGDDLTFIVNEDGEIKVEVVKKQRLSELFGILKTNKPYQPIDDIRKEVYRNMAEKEMNTPSTLANALEVGVSDLIKRARIRSGRLLSGSVKFLLVFQLKLRHLA